MNCVIMFVFKKKSRISILAAFASFHEPLCIESSLFLFFFSKWEVTMNHVEYFVSMVMHHYQCLEKKKIFMYICIYVYIFLQEILYVLWWILIRVAAKFLYVKFVFTFIWITDVGCFSGTMIVIIATKKKKKRKEILILDSWPPCWNG